MFKCKVDLEAFDTSNTKVDNIDWVKTKNLSKAAVKKLASSEGEKTPFYIVRDYFQKDDKPVGDFLAFGVAKKLEVHFSKQEVKGKGVATDKKNAAFGEACVKSVNGKQLVHFEPDPSCKIPSGAWQKLLKSLKPLLAGYKATVILDGVSLLEEGDDPNAPTTQVEDRMEYKTQVALDLMKEVEATTSIYDRAEKERLLEKTQKWLDAYAALSPEEQTPALKGHYDSIMVARRKVQTILATDDQILTGLNQVFGALEKLLQLPNHQDPKAQQLIQKLSTALQKIVPLVEAVKDDQLLEQCRAMQKILAQ